MNRCSYCFTLNVVEGGECGASPTRLHALKVYHLPGQHEQQSHGGEWFHGSHESLTELSTRPVESIDTFGTWVTSNSKHAGMLYGPNVSRAGVQAGNLLEAHTDNFDDFFFSNKTLFRSVFPNESLATLEEFKFKGLRKNEPDVWEKRKTYLGAFRKMLEDAGYNGVIWKNSRLDLGKSDVAHNVAVIFNTKSIPLSRVSKRFPEGFFDDYPDGPPGLFKRGVF